MEETPKKNKLKNTLICSNHSREYRPNSRGQVLDYDVEKSVNKIISLPMLLESEISL